MVYLDSRQYKEAETVLKAFAYKYPNLLLPNMLLGKLYYGTGEKEKALSVLTRVTERNPKVKNDIAKSIKREAQNIISELKI